ncbi:MAG: asparagine synthase-related protein [Pseudomonadota bacterium]
MKLRFLAAAGPADARRALASDLTHNRCGALVEGPSTASLSVWIDAGTPLLWNKAGTAIAVGLVFDRSANRALTSLPDWEGLERACVRDFWGTYVLLTSRSDGHSVLRDPSGAIPVYYGAAGGLDLYASDAEMLSLAWPEPFRPNLDAVRHWLRFPFLRTSRTGCAAVSELLPGLARDVGSGGERIRQAWSPTAFVSRESGITDFHQAVSLLGETVRQSVQRLGEGQANIVLQLSGGLDSSIVAAALSEGGVDYRAITFSTRSADGDERRYAGQVAQRLEIDLSELRETDVDLSVRTSSGPLQRPLSPLLQALRSAQCAAAGPDALLLDGGGGDNVFASISSAAPAIDAFRLCGLAEGVSAIRNLAARHGCTVWTAAASAFRRARRRDSLRWAADDSFLASSLPQVPDPHPWLESLGAMLPGSADHLRMIAGVHHFLVDPVAGQPCNLHPLITQPIVETCLRIRSWLWLEGGRDRAVARAAFRGSLPDAILDRRGKGSLQSVFVKGFAALRGELRDDLLSGRLAEQGIIDVPALARYLDRPGQPSDNIYVRVLEIASAEQWLRSFG